MTNASYYMQQCCIYVVFYSACYLYVDLVIYLVTD